MSSIPQLVQLGAIKKLTAVPRPRVTSGVAEGSFLFLFYAGGPATQCVAGPPFYVRFPPLRLPLR
jgi:hypothetical protein